MSSPRGGSPLSRLPLGFASVREVASYFLGAATLWYGAVQAPTDKAWIIVGAGLGLLGLPMVGGFFEKKE
jgi:hypothetical protein